MNEIAYIGQMIDSTQNIHFSNNNVIQNVLFMKDQKYSISILNEISSIDRIFNKRLIKKNIYM